MNNKIKRYNRSLSKRNSVHIRLLRARTTRMWVQSDKRIHALNYWYYRFFTKVYTDYLLRIYDDALGIGVEKKAQIPQE